MAIPVASMNNNPGNGSGPSIRGPDYVVFERLPQQAFNRTSLEKATAAKLKLEYYYKKAVDDVVERNGRCVAGSIKEGALLRRWLIIDTVILTSHQTSTALHLYLHLHLHSYSYLRVEYDLPDLT